MQFIDKYSKKLCTYGKKNNFWSYKGYRGNNPLEIRLANNLVAPYEVDELPTFVWKFLISSGDKAKILNN